jgi:hypothetical protein
MFSFSCVSIKCRGSSIATYENKNVERFEYEEFVKMCSYGYALYVFVAKSSVTIKFPRFNILMQDWTNKIQFIDFPN